uniref:Integrase core domain containing protein n=1 Tax=Solanum tuberosum TaxID=4113 RepID=M1DLX7_SOLTU
MRYNSHLHGVRSVEEETTMDRPKGNAHGQQQQGQREQTNNQQNCMSMEEILKKIMVNQAQLVADVRNNQLATLNLEKDLGNLLVPKTHDLKEVCRETRIQIPGK